MITQQQQDEADTQEIRLAVVLNGGVSLAVWISGVTLELHRLVQASRARGTGRSASPYAGLLDLLHARARIDVIAGTSAGGLNGGFLALGLVHGCDLAPMRDMWEADGDLATLLRDPREKAAPSLLRGGHFHERVAAAYRTISAARTGHAAVDEPVELFLTGTLWEGRRSGYTDDRGRRITEVDYDATFRFSSDGPGGGVGDLRSATVGDELAVASRCTSSFPGAFEPWWVEVDGAVGDRFASTAGQANFERSQYVVDGGVLRNKPVRPALDAVYRQKAGPQVRRVMAYVVPDPGERAQEPAPEAATGPVPHASDVLLGVLTRLRSTDSVSRELSEVQARNDEARGRRRTRDRLAQALTSSALESPSAGVDLPAAAFPAYREVRAEHAARSLPRLVLSGCGPVQRRWSPRELGSVLRELAVEPGLPFIPAGSLESALDAPPPHWHWGQSAVARLGDLTLDVLRRALWLAPLSDPETRAHLVDARKALHVVLDVVRQDRAALDRRWRDVGAELPSRSADSSPTREELAGLRAVLEKACTAWEGDQPDQRRAELYAQALGLAGVLHAARPALQAVTDQVTTAVDPDGSELDRLRLLLAVLLTGDTPEAVLRCLLRLEVVQVAFSGTSQDAEQEVELVQVSSARPDLLTGIQEHHFGAFYRRSWRTSDWLRGRLDGCAQLVEVLLAPDRLRQLGLGPDEALAALHDVAVGPAGSPHQEHLEARWREVEPRLAQELAPLGGTGRLPQTLPLVAARVAERLELEVLEQELPALADAIGLEDAPLVAGTNWAALYRAAAARSDRLGAADLLRLRQSAEVVGRQRVRAELTGGSDTFARTVSHAAASLTSLVGAVRGPALVRTVLSAVRGYALLVWVLVGYTTSRGTVGPHVLSMVVGVGGGLLGLALVVPGIPLVVPLTGAVLLLGAASSAGLRTCQGLGLRLAVAAGVALLALGGSIAWSVAEADAEQLRSSVITAVGKVAVVLAVLVLGWFLSRAKPPAGAGDPGVSAPRDRRRNVPAPRPASGSAKVGPPGVPPRGVRP